MAQNLISAAMQLLTPELKSRIASALGLDRALVDRSIGAAVPALLGSLSNTASKPGGADRILDAADQVDSGAFDRGAADVSEGADGNILSSLLGGSGSNALAGAIGKFAGVNTGTASSLLGMVAPAVLGAIRKSSPRLDASGLKSLLAGQKDNIAAAMPSGLSDSLRSSGLLDSATGAARSAHSATLHGAGQAAQSASRSRPSWLMWVIPLVLIAGAAWYFLGQRGEEPIRQAATTVGQTVESVEIGGVNVGRDLTGAVETATSSLGDITDVDTARSALPKLDDAAAQLDKVTGLIDRATPDQREILANVVATAMPTFNQLADKALATPGVADVAKPTVDKLRAKLEALANV